MTSTTPHAVQARARIALVAPYPPSLTETFILAHRDQLPADVLFIQGWRPMVDDRPVLSWPEIAMYKARRILLREPLARERTAAYTRAFARHAAGAVLAEYGQTAAATVDACRTLGIPLIAHFHGYDASVQSVLDEQADEYRKLFRHAAAIVAVSKAMRQRLIGLGAPPERTHWNPCGVDCNVFQATDPAASAPVLVVVGRLTEKKGPTYSIRAFAQALTAVPEARLRLLGDGPLREECEKLVANLGIGHAVEFLGAQPHAVVSDVLRDARAFVQHSVVAASGDSEGTPVAVLEAGASGLPVLGTRHAGIPDVVVHGETGLLVDERDVDGMAAHMVAVLRDAAFAGRLGAAARRHVGEHFSMDRSIERLWRVIEGCLVERKVA
jgi:colanic acid/amylovoran biosynthesis glycosyltransferase